MQGKTFVCDDNDLSGIAALTICESLLLALRDQKILSDNEILGVLDDAAGTHENASGSEDQIKKHQSVAIQIRQISQIVI